MSRRGEASDDRAGVNTRVRDGRQRAVIEDVAPQVDCGRFPIKRVVGEQVVVEADVFADGHDSVRCVVRYRHEDDATWQEQEMRPIGNDRWRGRFEVGRLGRYRYTVAAWVDHYATWRRELARRVDPADIAVAIEVGARLVEDAAERALAAEPAQATRLRAAAAALRQSDASALHRDAPMEPELDAVVARYPDRRFESHFDRELAVVVDATLARFGAWYEIFPRSLGSTDGQHGTIRDLISYLPQVAALGFDVLYLPPIHPIGRLRRKGPNNALVAGPGDPGSPWAIGASEGGHLAVHPALGSLEDLDALVDGARRLGLALALDIAFQCAPDHPYVT